MSSFLTFVLPQLNFAGLLTNISENPSLSLNDWLPLWLIYSFNQGSQVSLNPLIKSPGGIQPSSVGKELSLGIKASNGVARRFIYPASTIDSDEARGGLSHGFTLQPKGGG